MNTPDGHGSREASTQAETGVKPLLRTTSWSGHRAGAFERVVFKISEALRPLIAAHLTEEHSLLFAEPFTAPNGEVHWYAPVEGEVVSYLDLAAEDQAALDSHVNRLLFDLMGLATRLQSEAKTLEDFIMGQLLELQLNASYSERQCLYVVGEQPVFAFWVFESGQTSALFDQPVPAPRQPAPAPRKPVAAARQPEPAAPPNNLVEPAAPAPIVRPMPRPKPPVPRLQLALRRASQRRWAILAMASAVVLLGTFGMSPRETVVSWLDRIETIRASESSLLRRIALDEKARRIGVAMGVDPAAVKEIEGEGPPAEVAENRPAESLEEFAEPMPPFEGARGKLPIEMLQGSILLMHFWSATDPEVCSEITSFVSMVSSERFNPLRDLGGEAYLVTNEASAEDGNTFLKSCGVQDPYLLRDPEGKILKAIAPGIEAPATVVFDKLTGRTIATYRRRAWLDTAVTEELERLFLMQAF